MSRRQWTQASASQVTTWRRCPSKWYANKIIGITQPETEAMRRGKALHAELEAWELSGDRSKLGERTKHVTTYLTVPAEGLDRSHVERRVWLETPVVPILGFIDLELPAERTVLDHKTTSDWRYCKSEGALRWDAQATIYTYDALQRWGGDAPITFTHLYYRTRGNAASRKVEVELSAEYIRERFAGLVDELAKMAEHAVQPFEDVPANLDACNDFGGCPFRAYCRRAGKLPSPYETQGVTSSAKIVTRQGDSMNLLERIAQQKAAQAAAKGPVVTLGEGPPRRERVLVEQVTVNPPDGLPMDEPAPEPEPPKQAKPKQASLKLRNGKPVSKAPKAELMAEWHHLEDWAGQTAEGRKALPRDLEWDGDDRKIRVGALRRDVSRMLLALPSEAETVATWNKERAERWAAEDAASEEIDPEAIAEAQALDEAIAASEEPDPEAEAEAQAIAESEEIDPEAIAEAQALDEAIAASEEPDPDEAELDDLVKAVDEIPPRQPPALFIGCHPEGVSVVYLDEMIAKLQEIVARDANVSHYTTIRFSEGPKRVAGLLAAGLRTGEVSLPPALVIPSRAPCADAVVDVLLPFYRRTGGLIVRRMG